MGTGLGILAADGPDFMIHGLVKISLVWAGTVADNDTCQCTGCVRTSYHFCTHCPQ